ncbi:MAG: class I SAM-dependent methyltransferase [Candidatus Pacebacteria bacterium]|nr:class I SAM-dependent methyltransferase [Candidatus Paceibacterota bacterium]
MNGRRLIPGKPLPASEIPDYDVVRDTLEEALSPRFVSRLRRINDIVVNSGEALEGNIFYPHEDPLTAAAPPAAGLASARRNVWRVARYKRRFLEIGVNAGHSALLALSSNPKLIYYGVDLNEHAYTEPCVNYLKAEFPGQVEYFSGNSLEVLPALVASGADFSFDLFHVDGGHTSEVCASDIAHCIRLAAGRRGRHLMIDDTHASWIFDIVCEHVALGNLTVETFFDDWEDAGNNLLARIL